MDESAEMDSSSVITSSKSTPVLEAVKASFDAIALLVQFGVVGNECLSIALGRNYRQRLDLLDVLAQRIAVIGFIGQYGLSALAFEQRLGGGAVVHLCGGNTKPHRPTQCVGKHVDFCRQSASGTPQRLTFGPPFPLAACWWARTMVLSSIRYWLFRSALSVLNIRSHAPA